MFPHMQDFANADDWGLWDLTLEIRLAERTNAPQDAMFSNKDGTWTTWRSASPILREWVTRNCRRNTDD